MLMVTSIVGRASDPALRETLHRLSHEDRVEYLVLSQRDTLRHRLRATTDKGTECGVALGRSERLENGAVLALDDARAIVVRMTEQAWLTLEPRDEAAAIELGYAVGNLHWRVEFAGPHLRIALDGPEADYLDRLQSLLADGRIVRVSDA